MRRTTLFAAATALLLAAAAMPPSRAQEATPASAEQIERGIEVYKTYYCGACHVLEAAGTRGAFGPTHDGMAAIAAERLADPAYSGAAETPEAYIRESILDPAVYLVPGFLMTPHAMPSFAHLTQGDLDALVTLLLAQ